MAALEDEQMPSESSKLVDTEAGGAVRESKEPSPTGKLLIGLFIVLVIACSWVGSTQTAKSSYTSGFSAPYFATWFSTSWMMSVYPLTIPLFFLTRRTKPDRAGWVQLWRYHLHVLYSCTVDISLYSTIAFTIP